jgi:hypothetical protein
MFLEFVGRFSFTTVNYIFDLQLRSLNRTDWNRSVAQYLYLEDALSNSAGLSAALTGIVSGFPGSFQKN